jgi:hypothetical protein
MIQIKLAQTLLLESQASMTEAIAKLEQVARNTDNEPLNCWCYSRMSQLEQTSQEIEKFLEYFSRKKGSI